MKSVNLNPLLSPDIMENVQSFLSGYFFYATVSKTWRDVWAPHQAQKKDDVGEILQSASRVLDCKKVFVKKCLACVQHLATTKKSDTNMLGNTLMEIVDDRPDYVNLVQAAECGNVAFLVWAHAFTLQNEWDSSVCVLACHGNLTALKNILDLGYIPPPRASVSAAYNGHYKILKLLRQCGGSMRNVTQAFADIRDYSGLKWAVKNGIHWDRYTSEIVHSYN